MAQFLDRPPASGGAHVQDFDTLQADAYPRPFRSQHVRSGALGGGVKTTDLVHRFAWKRSKAHPSSVLLDPQVVFDETYQEMVTQHGASDAEATQVAMDRATEIVENAFSSGMNKAAQRLQSQLTALQRRLMNSQPPYGPDNSQIPVGASRADMSLRSPSGMRFTGTNTSPSARAPELNGQIPRANAEREQFSYLSADGRELTFTKRIGGRVVPEFTALLSLLCLHEQMHGGSPATVLGAAGLSLKDDHGQQLFEVQQEPELELSPSLTEVE